MRWDNGWGDDLREDETTLFNVEPSFQPLPDSPSPSFELVFDVPDTVPIASIRAVYVSHFLARWAWRTWEFAVALILMELHPTSLLLVSLYGLMDNLVRVLLGSTVGCYVDRYVYILYFPPPPDPDLVSLP